MSEVIFTRGTLAKRKMNEAIFTRGILEKRKMFEAIFSRGTLKKRKMNVWSNFYKRYIGEKKIDSVN